MQQQSYNTLNSGINSFVTASPDYELAPLGLASLTEQADRLAEYGRNGDIYVVHAAEGETVIPMEVLEANPQIKELLFNQMRDMGMNPTEYVVGNELNSINPDTGMPEFFFKSIFKAVKKVFKAVAPIVVPILGNMILPGIGGILASAMYTKLSGGSWGDVLKGAALSYVGGAAMQGFTGAGSFAENFSAGLTAPFDAVSNIGQSFDQGIFGGAGAANLPGASLKDQAFRTFDPDAAQSGVLAGTPPPQTFGGGPDTFSPGASGVDTGGGYFPSTSGAAVAPASGFDNVMTTMDATGNQFNAAGQEIPFGNNQSINVSTGDPSAAARAVPVKPTAEFDVSDFGGLEGNPPTLGQRFDSLTSSAEKYFDQGSDLLFGETPSQDSIYKLAAKNVSAAKAQGLTLSDTAAIAAAEAELAPSTLRQYGPIGAGLAGAAYLGGAFDQAEDPYAEQREKDRLALEAARGPNRLLASNPDRYMVRDLDPTKYAPTATFAAEGGLMQLRGGGSAQYPRREMLVEGPGTERSDDIPAMLSDGEFVLNAKSVRGADPTGQGNRYRGAQNLYGMMRDFEMRG